MIADDIAFHAEERPHAVALINNGREITYAKFSRDIGRFTRALRDFGLPPGSSAAIACDDLYVHWLLLLAFEQLGVVTASFFVGREPGAYLPLLARDDLVLSDRDVPGAKVKRHHPITKRWLRGIFALPARAQEEPAQGSPDDPVRILSTSGTTGSYERLLLSRRMHDARVNRWIWCYGLTNRCRYLVVMPFAVGGVYSHATACLRSGGTVVWEGGLLPEQALSAHGITHVTLLPIQLRQVLDRLPQDFVKPQNLTISCFGAAISKTLRDRATARLASEICDMYGANEVAFMCSRRHGETGFGTVWPGVRVEVVDENGRPVPRGETGRIRVKTESMFAGYLDDPEATRRMVRDGWFYPGDLGILRGPRQLEVVTRQDDLLNIGGLKVPPATIEDQVRKKLPVRDVGVCSIRNADGIEEVWVAVSAEADSADKDLVARVKEAFGHGENADIHVIALARIPRNAAGKIQRHLLKEAVMREAQLEAPPTKR